MVDEKTNKKKSEEDFEGIKFAECFSNLLNLAAFGIIITIIILLFSNSCCKVNKEKKEVTNEIKIQYVPTGNSKIDTIKFNNLIDEKLKEFKTQLKDSEKERNENMKYYGTMLSFILAIVGFFGFKSVHDTRQMAIDAVKVKAEEVAKKATSEKISDLTKEHVEDFLTKDGKKDIEEIAEKIASEKGVEVAKEEMSLIKIDNDNYRKGIQEDIETTQRFQNNNFNFLLKRIQELELKLYGKPGDDDLPDFDNNPKINPDNEQPVL